MEAISTGIGSLLTLLTVPVEVAWACHMIQLHCSNLQSDRNWAARKSPNVPSRWCTTVVCAVPASHAACTEKQGVHATCNALFIKSDTLFTPCLPCVTQAQLHMSTSVLLCFKQLAAVTSIRHHPYHHVYPNYVIFANTLMQVMLHAPTHAQICTANTRILYTHTITCTHTTSTTCYHGG